jgi:hypothetical protein
VRARTRRAVCSVARCGRPLLAHGLCSTHEMRRRAKQSLARPVKPQRVYSDADVRAALELAGEVGPIPAARELGIPRSTVQGWVRGRRRN